MHALLIRTFARHRPPAFIMSTTPLHIVPTAGIHGTTTSPARGARTPPRRYRSPNFFVGFRIANPQLIDNVWKLQDRIAVQFPDVARCLIDIRTLHVTLCTLHLETEEDICQAVRIVEEYSLKAGLPPFRNDPPTFDFRGVDFFGNNFILYIPLDVSSPYADILAELAETMHTAFDALELTTGPFKKPYTPHLTVWKTTKFIKYVKQLNQSRAVPIEYELGDFLKASEPELFGTEQPTSVELLSMREKEPDGYYKVYKSASLIRTDDQDDEEGKEHKVETTPPSVP